MPASAIVFSFGLGDALPSSSAGPGGGPGRTRSARRGLVEGPRDCREGRGVSGGAGASSAAARSAGSSEAKASASPVAGCVKASRWACRNWRSRPYHRPPVGDVADQRVADRREVGADLVGAPGLQPRLQIGLGGEQLEHREVGARLARGGAGDRHPVPLPRRAPDRRVDRAGARARAALRPAPGRRARPRGAGPAACEGAVRLVGAGDDHQAAGVLVEAVDDPGALRILPHRRGARPARRPASGRCATAPGGRRARPACRRRPGSRRGGRRGAPGHEHTLFGSAHGAKNQIWMLVRSPQGSRR